MKPHFHTHPPHLNTPTAYQVLRTHNCPNCNCNSNSRVSKEVISRPISPTCNLCSPFTSAHLPHQQQMPIQPLAARRNPGSAAIYYQRSDRYKDTSSHSNHSLSSAKSNVATPTQRVVSPPRVNIRYLSPGLNEGLSGRTGGQVNRPPPYLKVRQDPPTTITQMQRETEVKESLPRVPSILKRKVSLGKRGKQERVESNSQKREQEKKSQGWDWVTKMSGFGTDEKQECGLDLQLEKEEQFLIAMQISRDLKLHYDYYETQDITRISNPLHEK